MSELKVYEGLISHIPSIGFAMFAGTWADRRGRKLVMVLPFIGELSVGLETRRNAFVYYYRSHSELYLVAGLCFLLG